MCKLSSVVKMAFCVAFRIRCAVYISRSLCPAAWSRRLSENTSSMLSAQNLPKILLKMFLFPVLDVHLKLLVFNPSPPPGLYNVHHLGCTMSNIEIVPTPWGHWSTFLLYCTDSSIGLEYTPQCVAMQKLKLCLNPWNQ